MRLVSSTAICVMLGFPVAAQDIAVTAEDIKIGGQEYSPYLHQSFPDRVFFGDTHLHTSYSTDAGMIGNRLGPDEALRRRLYVQQIVATFSRGGRKPKTPRAPQRGRRNNRWLAILLPLASIHLQR